MKTQNDNDFIYNSQREIIFKDVLILLKKENTPEQAFALANILAYEYQNCHNIFSLMLLAAKQQFEPAIQELKNIPLDRPYCYEGKYYFYLLSSQEIDKLRDFLVRSNNIPSTKQVEPNRLPNSKQNMNPSAFMQSSLNSSPNFFNTMSSPQPLNKQNKDYEKIIEQLIELEVMPSSLKYKVMISDSLNIIDITKVEFSSDVAFETIEEIAQQLKLKGLNCSPYKRYEPLITSLNSIRISLKVNALEEWLNQTCSNKGIVERSPKLIGV
ncbi:MAG: hypothetical protein QM652_00655 [Legionella sp.]|uniref:hypothetical protein n=1 Tax=Legionella sp. TaxID=459 RepID=UPI0039E49A27